MATATIYANNSEYQINGGSWQDDHEDGIYAGKNSTGSNSYKSRLSFSTSQLAPYINKNINSITFYIYRTYDGYSTSDKALYYQTGSSSNWGIFRNEQWKAVYVPDVSAFLNDGILTLFGGSNNTYCKLRPHNYSGKTPYVVIDYSEDPQPQPPSSITSIGTITFDTKTFSWSAGSDSSGVVSSNDLYYEMQISTDGGSSFGATYTSSKGTTSKSIDIKDYLNIQDAQYYYNANFKIRVRTKLVYDGDTSYSDWIEASGIIDYRIAPSEPLNMSLNAQSLFEGQELVISCDRPTDYNSHDSDGNVMNLTYTVKFGSDIITTKTVASTQSSISIIYTIGELCTGKYDISNDITVYCKDSNNQIGISTEQINLEIKRFRRPNIVAEYERQQELGTIKFKIDDTGYGGTQSISQVTGFEYRVDGELWLAIPLDDWTSMDNQFNITGLDEDDRKLIELRCENIPPTGLSAVESNIYPVQILEYTPVWGTIKNVVTNKKAMAIKSLIVGADFQQQIETGDLVVNGIKFSEIIARLNALDGGSS